MEQLLQDIREFIVAATNDDLTEEEREALRFSNGAEIVEAIDNKLNTGTMMVEQFDPYSDPETKAMLERAGIATHRHRR